MLDLSRLADDPTFAAVRPQILALAGQAPSLDVESLDRVLAERAGVRFEPQLRTRRRGEPFVPASSYDGAITTRGAVPTRPGSVHDLMNALVWAAFPRSKRAIHRRQFAALTAEVEAGAPALPGRRSRLRDRLSMLDEGGAVLAARGSVTEVEAALAAGDLAHLRALRRTERLSVWVLGHAILEHAAGAGTRGVRAAVAVVTAEPAVDAVDAALTAALDRDDASLERFLGRWPSLEIDELLAQ